MKEYSAKIGKGALNITRFWFGDNELWVNRYEDNLYHSEDAARFTVFRDAEGEEPFKGAIITTCVKGLHNCIYIGSSNGLAEINLTTRKVRRLLNDYVRNICLRSDTELWVGTEQGIYIYNLKPTNISTSPPRSPTTATHYPTTPSTPSSKTVKAECG